MYYFFCEICNFFFNILNIVKIPFFVIGHLAVARFNDITFFIFTDS